MLKQQVRVVIVVREAMVAGLHSSQSHLRKKRACLVLRLYCNTLNQGVRTEQPDTQDGGEKARSHPISVLASTVINGQSIKQCTYRRRVPLSVQVNVFASKQRRFIFPDACPQPCTLHALLAALLGSIDVYQWSRLESHQSVTLRRQRVNLCHP